MDPFTADDLNILTNCKFFSFDGQTHFARVVKCYDGDTIHCVFKYADQYYKFRIRLNGYDSSELKPSKSLGETKCNEIKTNATNAKKRLEELILNRNVWLQCGPFDKYGRILGTIKMNLNDVESINDLMIREGHGYVYNGGTKKVAYSGE